MGRYGSTAVANAALLNCSPLLCYHAGSLDGEQRLIVKGRFQPKAFEGCLRRYMNE